MLKEILITFLYILGIEVVIYLMWGIFIEFIFSYKKKQEELRDVCNARKEILEITKTNLIKQYREETKNK
jgi:hypothetical protein